MYFKMRGNRGYNICPWLKNGKHETCGKYCRDEYCKVHRFKIRTGSKIPRPCLGCGSGIRSQIQLCRGCGRETERKRLHRLRLLCTFRSIIFFKAGFLSQNIGRSVIFNFKKKIIEKTKFWRRNRSFTFTPEVKVYPLIDSPMMLCNQPRRLSRD